MLLPALERLIGVSLLGLLAALAAIIVWKVFTRQMDLAGLLSGDRLNGQTYFSPGRVQLLMVTTLVAVNLIAHIVAHPTAFPPVPKELLLALAGSHAVYLGGKASAMLPWTTHNL